MHAPVTRSPAFAALATLALAALGAPSIASAQQATDRGRLELQVGAQAGVHSTAELADGEPGTSINVRGGYYVADRLQIAAGYTTDVADADADASELAVIATASVDLPLVRGFAGAGLGYFWTEQRFGDAVFDDRGPRLIAEAGLRLKIPRGPGAWLFAEPSLRATYAVTHSIHHDRNTSFPEYVRTLAITAAIPLSF